MLFSSLKETRSQTFGISCGSVWSSNITLIQLLEIGDWKTWEWCVIHAYILHIIWSFIFECPFRFFLLVHTLFPTLMALRFYFADSTWRIAVLFLTSNLLVNKHSDILALGLLTVVCVTLKPGLISVTSSRL